MNYQYFLLYLLWSSAHLFGAINTFNSQGVHENNFLPNIPNELFTNHIWPDLYERPKFFEEIAFEGCLYNYYLINKQWNEYYKHRFTVFEVLCDYCYPYNKTKINLIKKVLFRLKKSNITSAEKYTDEFLNKFGAFDNYFTNRIGRPNLLQKDYQGYKEIFFKAIALDIYYCQEFAELLTCNFHELWITLFETAIKQSEQKKISYLNKVIFLYMNDFFQYIKQGYMWEISFIKKIITLNNSYMFLSNSDKLIDFAEAKGLAVYDLHNDLVQFLGEEEIKRNGFYYDIAKRVMIQKVKIDNNKEIFLKLFNKGVRCPALVDFFDPSSFNKKEIEEILKNLVPCEFMNKITKIITHKNIIFAQEYNEYHYDEYRCI